MRRTVSILASIIWIIVFILAYPLILLYFYLSSRRDVLTTTLLPFGVVLLLIFITAKTYDDEPPF